MGDLNSRKNLPNRCMRYSKNDDESSGDNFRINYSWLAYLPLWSAKLLQFLLFQLISGEKRHKLKERASGDWVNIQVMLHQVLYSAWLWQQGRQRYICKLYDYLQVCWHISTGHSSLQRKFELIISYWDHSDAR